MQMTDEIINMVTSPEKKLVNVDMQMKWWFQAMQLLIDTTPQVVHASSFFPYIRTKEAMQ